MSVARTIDPERHAARRLVIIDAALTCFATLGYAGASTAAICREAGIGSGTFFHYFPTKAAVLVAILAYGTRETTGFFDERAGRHDALPVIREYVDHVADDAADARLPGFVRAVGAVVGEPEIDAALAADDRALRERLTPWLQRAQVAGEVRSDVSPQRLTSWLMLLFDGFVGRLAAEPGFDATAETPMLRDSVERLLADAPPRGRPGRC
jgi:AcrR family transcriptional regulator